jgi:predicted enzyme related to lactoylglutathione lyase
VPNNIVHFDIQADDLERAQRFYSQTFGWRFEAWGPPDFFLITTGDETNLGIHGALTRRHAPVVRGGRNGFECTIQVDDIKRAMSTIEAEGGEIIGEPVEIPTVGIHVPFRDTEGNVVVIMQYEAGYCHPALRGTRRV